MTTNVLTILASANPQSSTSEMLAQQAHELFSADSIRIRDTSQGIPAIDADWISAAYTPEPDRSAAQKHVLSLSDQLIGEIVAADELVIATPMYNFSMPSGLKAWIDQITRVGVSFQYTDSGPQGLLTDKPVTLIISTGGVAVDSEVDFLTPYLRHVMGFLGMHQVTTVAAQGMNISAEQGLHNARIQLQQLAQQRALAA